MGVWRNYDGWIWDPSRNHLVPIHFVFSSKSKRICARSRLFKSHLFPGGAVQSQKSGGKCTCRPYHPCDFVQYWGIFGKSKNDLHRMGRVFRFSSVWICVCWNLGHRWSRLRTGIKLFVSPNSSNLLAKWRRKARWMTEAESWKSIKARRTKKPRKTRWMVRTGESRRWRDRTAWISSFISQIARAGLECGENSFNLNWNYEEKIWTCDWPCTWRGTDKWKNTNEKVLAETTKLATEGGTFHKFFIRNNVIIQ